MNDTTTTTTDAAQRGPFKLLTGTLFKPGATMRYLRQAQRRWWVFPAVLMVVALMIHAVGFAKANAEYLYQQQLTSFESMPPEKRGPMTQPPPKAIPPLLTTGIQIGGRTVATIAGWLIWAGWTLPPKYVPVGNVES